MSKYKLNPVWQARLNRFKKNRLGVVALVLFCLISVICLGANFVANDKPLVVTYEGDVYFPDFKA